MVYAVPISSTTAAFSDVNATAVVRMPRRPEPSDSREPPSPAIEGVAGEDAIPEAETAAPPPAAPPTAVVAAASVLRSGVEVAIFFFLILDFDAHEDDSARKCLKFCAKHMQV